MATRFASSDRTGDGEITLFHELAARVRTRPAEYADAAGLARAVGLRDTALAELLRVHAHSTPEAWLDGQRVRAAGRLLLETGEPAGAIARAVGFDGERDLERQFAACMRLTPAAYRESNGELSLALPAGYRAQEILAYHARDPKSPCERVDGRALYKALIVHGRPVVLEIALEHALARCRAHTDVPLDGRAREILHSIALRMLGLWFDVEAFELRAACDARLAAVVARRRGLRLPLTPTVFDGLCWAIIGQQINLAFASSLRRELLAVAGTPVGDMVAHPDAARVASLSAEELTTRRFSRSKAEYLIGAARAVAEGRLDVEKLGDGSAVAAERALTSIRGIGTWTARYVLMRGAGFADCAPIGDAALAAAAQKLTAATERPVPQAVERLLLPFAPYRSLATLHLWASLEDSE